MRSANSGTRKSSSGKIVNASEEPKQIEKDALPFDPALLTPKQKSKLIHEALAKLSEEDRALITALYFDNISIHKLAKQLGISRPAVRYRKSNALKQLKEIIIKKLNEKIAK